MLNTVSGIGKLTNLNSKIRTIVFWNAETKWFLPSLFVLGLALFLLRKPFLILTQPGRVEDVDVLLAQAIQHSWQSIFLTYNYYFHVVPRLVTFVSLSLLGIANVNLGMNLAAIVIATTCAVFFATKQFRFVIKSDLLRAVCSLFIILVPGVDEIYSNISSIQWFLNIFIMLFTMLLIFRYDEFEKKSKKIKCLYGFLCSVSFLSSAFSLVFIPAMIYVLVRELRKKERKLVTISSYGIPTVLLVFQALVLYITYSQQFRSSALGLDNPILSPTVNAFTISLVKIFYYNTATLFQYAGQWMYLIPIAVIVFIILGSIKDRSKLELYSLACMVTTLLWTSAVRSSLLDWACLCGQAEERYFFFTIIFAFILIVRQFDQKRSKHSQYVLLAVLTIVFLNAVSGFLIPSSADNNWKYVTKLYDSSGSYHCYVGEVPDGWGLAIPCSSPAQNNMTAISSLGAGPSITFTPPVQSTTISLSSVSYNVISKTSTTFTATVFPTPDGGAVQFQIDGTNVDEPVTIFGGQAHLNTNSLEVGYHKVSASYFGAPNFYPSSSNFVTINVLSRLNLNGANLSGSDLGDADLSGLDMEGVNLSNANLQDAILSNTNLKNANLSGAVLMDANLMSTNLEKANLQNANLQDANLSGANLQGGNLLGAILSNVNMTNSNLKGANIAGANFASAITKGCEGCP